MLSHVDVYVRFRDHGGTPFSYEPRKWFNCLHLYGVYPDDWVRTDLHRRIVCCWLSEFLTSLNLQLRVNGPLEADLKTIFDSLPGATEVQIFSPIATTPPRIPIPLENRPKADVVPFLRQTAA